MTARACASAVSLFTLLAVVGCSSNGVSPAAPGSHPAPPDAFVGTWRSTTAPYEFVGVDIQSLSVEQGLLAARVTYSGVAMEGTGRIDADSLVIALHFIGTSA